MALRRSPLWPTILLLAACADAGELASRRDELAVPGPWQIPENTLAAGDTQYVAYEGAGPWLGEAGCSGGLLPGTQILGEYLTGRFGQISLVGGYACRPIRGTTETMSLHGVGRALDVHIPETGDPLDADNDLGDEVGHFLIEHAELFGVQLIIWDEWSWGASRAEGAKGRIYTGVNPHHDHLHVELSVEASMQEDDWFSAGLGSDVAQEAGADAASMPDAAVTDESVDDASAPSAPDGTDAPSLEPRTPRPVIEPVLDDDPLPGNGPEAEPLSSAPPVFGSTCSASHTAADDGALALAIAACVLLIRRGRRKR